MRRQIKKLIQAPFVFAVLSLLLLASCNASNDKTSNRSKLQWGEHASGMYANLINLKPNESVEVCADDPEWIPAAHSAIEKWSTVLGRWGHFKVNNCGAGSTVKINMSPFNQTGLNYFTENPGRIYIQGSAQGNFMKAIVLHEFGHSFGMCDQYTDVGTANCSGNGSGRQENSEVMGSTSADKQNLTAGDIAGVKALAKSSRIRANQLWDDYLAGSPTPSTGTSSISFFAALSSNANDASPSVLVSVEKSKSFILCAESAQATCGDSTKLPMQFKQTVGDRDIYETVNLMSNLSKSGPNIFIIKQDSKQSKFKVTAI